MNVSKTGVGISLKYERGDLTFKVYNTKDSFMNTTDSAAEKSSGLGIANTKRRLEILYPHRHELTLINKEDYYEVTLILFDV